MIITKPFAKTISSWKNPEGTNFPHFLYQIHYHSYIEADEGEDLLRLRQKDLLPMVPIQNVNRVIFQAKKFLKWTT